jgi:peptide/nickel transport system permease protein
MKAYIIRRLLLSVPTLIIVTMVVFWMIRAIPGSAVDLILAQNMSSGTVDTTLTREEIEHRLGLDKPIVEQYFRWVIGVFRGDLGHSLYDVQYWGAEKTS